MPSRHAIVLAGGLSSRMGRPKAWLELPAPQGGRKVALLRHVVERMLPACDDVVVVAAPGQPLPELPVSIGRTCRVDDPPERVGGGPLAAVLTGLESLPEDGLVYIGSVDAALVTPAHLRQIFDALERDARVDAVVPASADERGEQRLHALAGAARGGPAKASAHRLLAAGESRMQALYRELATCVIMTDDLVAPEVTTPCNTPEQWAAVVARLGETGALHEPGAAT